MIPEKFEDLTQEQITELARMMFDYIDNIRNGADINSCQHKITKEVKDMQNVLNSCEQKINTN